MRKRRELDKAKLVVKVTSTKGDNRIRTQSVFDNRTKAFRPEYIAERGISEFLDMKDMKETLNWNLDGDEDRYCFHWECTVHGVSYGTAYIFRTYPYYTNPEIQAATDEAVRIRAQCTILNGRYHELMCKMYPDSGPGVDCQDEFDALQPELDHSLELLHSAYEKLESAYANAGIRYSSTNRNTAYNLSTLQEIECLADEIVRASQRATTA